MNSSIKAPEPLQPVFSRVMSPPPAPLKQPLVGSSAGVSAPVNKPTVELDEVASEPTIIPATVAPVAAFSDPVEVAGNSNQTDGVNVEAKAYEMVHRIKNQYSSVMVGQETLQETLLIALLSGGHVLLESLPGLAKTTAAHSLANSISGTFSRIQCTPDLLPGDIVGTEIYNQNTNTFDTRLGPVHANFVLLDEINRSSAKTQSAMLEAMQEKQTSIGGVMHKIVEPFMVVATQNPIEQEGTYVLPEAQLDRFMLKDVLTYSSPQEEYQILEKYDAGLLNFGNLKPVVSLEEVLWLRETARKVFVDPVIRQYIINLVTASRNVGEWVGEQYGNCVHYGASPRASIAFLDAVRAVALIEGRNHVTPDDVKHVAYRVLRHRIILNHTAELEGVTGDHIVSMLLSVVPVP